MLPAVQGAEDLWLLSRERMREDRSLYPGQKFWLTIVCFLIAAVTVIVVVAIAATHGAWHG